MGRDDSVEQAGKGVPQESPSDVQESAELVLFQVRECYVYMIPPRKSAASYRADEWDINKWNWEGALRVVSKGEDCCIRLEDSTSGELYAQALVRPDYPLPVEAVIDSSRFFVLRIEDTSSSESNSRHAFIGLGFRERPEAYDFQAALFDYLKYLNKKKEAEEMGQEYESRPSVDYSLKEGETFRLQLKTQQRSSGDPAKVASGLDGICSLEKALPETYKTSSLMRVVSGGHGHFLVPPPPPPFTPISASSPQVHPDSGSPILGGVVGHSGSGELKLDLSEFVDKPVKAEKEKEAVDEDFGDFQAA